MQWFRSGLLFVAVLSTPGAWAAICGDETPNNSCLRADEPIKACQTALQNNPASTSARLAYCEALALEKQLDEAKVAVGQGIARCSGRDCQRLKLAMSYLEERRVARDRADPREAERKRAADRQFCLTPFNNARSVSACERLLLSSPKDESIYAALINKQLKMGEPSNALAYALQARTTIGNNTLFSELIADANAQRKAVVDDCLTDNSISKCEQAYLAGAEDEYLIQTRRGELHLEKRQFSQAQELLTAAQALRPNYASTNAALIRLKSLTAPDKVTPEQGSPVAGTPDTQPQLVAEQKSNESKPSSEPEISPTTETNTSATQGFLNAITAQGTSF